MAKELQKKSPVNYFSPYILGAILFLIYLATTPRSVTFEDSGLFISAIQTWGLPQPPGYPLYIFLGQIFNLIPFLGLAFKVHLISIFSSLGALLFLQQCLLKLNFSQITAFLTVLIIGLGETFWSQSIVAEVYTLQAFIASGLFYFSLCLLDVAATKKMFFLFGLFFGLGFANHWPLHIVLSPFFILMLLPVREQILKNCKIIISSAFAIFSFFYSILIWRSQSNSEISFLGPINDIFDFISFFGRSYYKPIEAQWQSALSDKLHFIFDFLMQLLWLEWKLFGLLFLIGLFLVIQQKSDKWIWLLLVFAVPLILPFQLSFEYSSLNINVLKVFYVPSFLFSALFMATGIQWFFEKLKWQRWLTGSVLFLFLALIGRQHFISNDLRTDQFAEDFARILFQALPQKNNERLVLIAGTDADVGPLSYLRYGLNVRPEIDLYTQSGVFFSRRIFYPYEPRTSVRIEKTKSFIQENSPIFSTKAFDLFDQNNPLPFFSEFNGLFHEVSKDPLQTHELSSSVILSIESALQKYIDNPRVSNWHYYREVLAGRLCNALILKKESSSIFDNIKSCRQVKARHFHRTKRFDEAEVIFSSLVAELDKEMASDRHNLRYYQLINRLDKINSLPDSKERKAELMIGALKLALQALDDWPHCANGVLTVIRSLQKQIVLPNDILKPLENFTKCQK